MIEASVKLASTFCMFEVIEPLINTFSAVVVMSSIIDESLTTSISDSFSE